MRNIVIVGAGFTGTTLAVQLAQKGNSKICLIEKMPAHFFTGPAYKDQSIYHSLNVRAKDMGAIDGKPDDFFHWLTKHYPNVYGPMDFVPRKIYGEYLKCLIEPYLNSSIKVIQDEIIDLVNNEAVGKKENYQYDTIFLCLGGNYLTPSLNQLDPMLIKIKGAGLSAIDLIVDQVKNGYQGKFELYSRRGLMPLIHDHSEGSFHGPKKLLEYFQEIKHISQTQNATQYVVNELRPKLKEIWESFTNKEKSQFYRYLKPYWEIFRHRMTPDQFQILQELKVQNRLKIIKINKNSDMQFDVDCSGFQPPKAELIKNLCTKGYVMFDQYGIGFTSKHPQIKTIGPMEKYYKFEITAVREIRREVANLVQSF